MGTTFTNIFIQADSNIEYQDGREIVFRISDKENNDDPLPDTAVEEIADVMEDRLNNSGISRYEIQTAGNDTVKVIFSEQDTSQYQNIIYYLSFNGEFAISTSTDVVALGDEFLTDSKAYLDTINSYPCVVIPVDTSNEELNAVIEEANKLKDDGEGETSTDSEGNETTTTYIYLWCDYEEGDTYSKTQESSDDYDAKVAEKIIMKFNVTDGIWFPDDEENKLGSAINVDTNGDGVASVKEVETAYATARYYINLLNSEALDYDITYMYDQTVSAWTENLINYGAKATLAWSNTLLATVVSIIVLCLVLIVFYRLGAVSTLVMTLASVFGGIGFLVLFGVQFNLATIIGLSAVALASIVSSIIYFTKLKEEAYRGRSLKKSNTEASKKSLLPIVDANVVLIVIGAFAYLLGGTLMNGFAAVTVLGGLISLILNTLGLKMMMWLATNTTALTGKYAVFGIDPKLVPDLTKEEKQTYYGPYQDKNLTKKNKPVGIVASVLFVASLVGMITFGVLNNGNIYNAPSSVANSQIFFETTTDNSALNETYINNLLEHIYLAPETTSTIDGDLATEQYDAISNFVVSIDDYERTDTENGVEVNYYYYTVTLDSSFPTSTTNAFYSENGTDSDVMLVNDALEYALNESAIDTKASVSMKDVTIVNIAQPAWEPIVLSTFVGTAVLCLYFMLRYRLSRGLSSIIIATLVGGISLGFFSLTRLVTSTYVTIALPFIIIATLLFSILFMNRERELVVEDRKNDNSIEAREQIMVKATSLAFSPIIAVLCVSLLMALCFFGFGPLVTSYTYLMILVGLLVGALLVTVLYGPLSQLFYRWFSRVHINIKPKKEKKKKKQFKAKSAEPEEAIFIGIND